MLESGAEVASAAGIADSAIPPVMGVSDLPNIATGILVLWLTKLKGNSSDS